MALMFTEEEEEEEKKTEGGLLLYRENYCDRLWDLTLKIL